jgi:CPA2 family monovalent cation:H+ antiporter-2
MHDLIILRDLAIIFATAVLVVALLRRVGIPTIAGFIVAGILVGPKALGLIGDVNQVSLMAEVGVALLLFGIGLELSLERLRRLWRSVIIGGALQVGLTVGAVLLLSSILNVSLPQATLLGCIIAVSSTAIVLRALESRGDLDAPHGRLTLGILVFQDLCVIPMMLAIPLLAGGSTMDGWVWIAVLVTVVALTVVVLTAYFIVPRVLHWVAGTRQRDLFILTALVVCIGTAWVATRAGVSLALGAFLAGLIISGSEYRHQAMADLIPFREVLTSLFFVSIGMLLDPLLIIRDIGPVTLWVASLIVGKSLIVMAVVWMMRLPLRVAILAGVSLAQVGEFSFVLFSAADGTSLLAVPFRETLLASIIVSMVVTPLIIAQGPKLAEAATRSRWFGRLFSPAPSSDEDDATRQLHDHVIIAGWGVSGEELGHALRAAGIPYVVVDLNPQTVRQASADGEPMVYGDVTAPDVLEHLGIHRARMLVMVINDPDAAERGVRTARRLAPTLPILVRARFVASVDGLFKAGATDVVPAELEAAVEVTARVLLACGADVGLVTDERTRIRTRRKDEAADSEGDVSQDSA